MSKSLRVILGIILYKPFHFVLWIFIALIMGVVIIAMIVPDNKQVTKDEVNIDLSQCKVYSKISSNQYKVECKE